jgi:adenine-specific DNA-methyltransferase
MIKYLGSKRLLIPDILSAISSIQARGTVLDLFSGTSRVGHALKRAGYRVLANDHNTYAHTLATCYVQADAEDWLNESRALIPELNDIARITLQGFEDPSAPSAPTGQRATGGVGASPTEPVVDSLRDSSPRRGEGKASPADSHPDFFTQTYCLDSRFFHPSNGPRIHAIREDIGRRRLHPELNAVALTSLLEAADRVDSTTGVQMAYLKQWAPRAHNDLTLRVPDILPRATRGGGKGHASCLDAAAAARSFAPEADVIYLDPPYNQHSYLGNYHIWETLVRWDAPDVYGTARKRLDCRERKSPFNSKRAMHDAMEEVLDACGDRALVVSFSDEGYLTREELTTMLMPRGRMRVITRDYKRYVGAQIGIYNPSGERVGKVSHLRNTEMLFIVTPRRPTLSRTATVRERKLETARPLRYRRAVPA